MLPINSSQYLHAIDFLAPSDNNTRAVGCPPFRLALTEIELRVAENHPAFLVVGFRVAQREYDPIKFLAERFLCERVR